MRDGWQASLLKPVLYPGLTKNLHFFKIHVEFELLLGEKRQRPFRSVPSFGRQSKGFSQVQNLSGFVLQSSQVVFRVNRVGACDGSGELSESASRGSRQRHCGVRRKERNQQFILWGDPETSTTVCQARPERHRVLAHQGAIVWSVAQND